MRLALRAAASACSAVARRMASREVPAAASSASDQRSISARMASRVHSGWYWMP
jgi:hypothetical protein